MWFVGKSLHSSYCCPSRKGKMLPRRFPRRHGVSPWDRCLPYGVAFAEYCAAAARRPGEWKGGGDTGWGKRCAKLSLRVSFPFANRFDSVIRLLDSIYSSRLAAANRGPNGAARPMKKKGGEDQKTTRCGFIFRCVFLLLFFSFQMCFYSCPFGLVSACMAQWRALNWIVVWSTVQCAVFT